MKATPSICVHTASHARRPNQRIAESQPSRQLSSSVRLTRMLMLTFLYMHTSPIILPDLLKKTTCSLHGPSSSDTDVALSTFAAALLDDIGEGLSLLRQRRLEHSNSRLLLDGSQNVTSRAHAVLPLPGGSPVE